MTGPELLAEIIRAMREGIAESATDEELALRLWPHFERMVLTITVADREALHEDLQRWRAERHNPAAELGRKGGKKGGPARAKKLSEERRAEIARKAARARWSKAKEGGGK